MPKSQISPLTDFVKLLIANILQLLRNSEKSVIICQNLSKSVRCADLRRRTYPSCSLRSLLPLRSLREALFPFVFFVVESGPRFTAITGKTRSAQPNLYRTKNIVFAKKSLPDFPLIPCSSITYRNRRSSFLRTFSHFFAILRKLKHWGSVAFG